MAEEQIWTIQPIQSALPFNQGQSIFAFSLQPLMALLSIPALKLPNDLSSAPQI